MTLLAPEEREAARPHAAGGEHRPPPGEIPLLDFGPRWRFSWRALLGCLAVVLAAATTTVVVVEGQLNQLAGALSHGPTIRLGNGQLAPAGFGDAQTLLLVGNDWRPHTTTGEVFPHSNEMLLVRFDPSKPWISMMSIPRELMVNVPCPNGVVTTRFNYALQCGGVSTLLRTVKQVTGLQVNHVAMLDFNNFVRAVNEIGCVYATIDRRYFHVNVPGGAQYFQVNLQPGYQRLCGQQALQFVSYRHGDDSLVRDARDQSFLLAVKQQYGPTLIDNIGKFERIFGQTVTADNRLRSSTGLLNLIGTLISSAGHPVRQVHFPVNLSPTDPLATACSCVTATPQMIAGAIHSFLDGRGGLPPKTRTNALARAIGRRGHHPRGPALRPTGSGELAAAKAAAGRTPFQLEFPTVQDQVTAAAPPSIRDYLIHAPGGRSYPIFVEVFATGQLGQYYDLQGTTWLTAPALDSPAQVVRIRGRTYFLWYTGAHLVQVAWYAHHAVYWIHNSLSDSVGNGDMLAIAEQSQAVAGGRAAARRVVRLHAAPAPKFVPRPQPTALTNEVGSLGGLLTLALVPLGLLAVVLHRRQLVRLRREVLEAVSRMAWLETQMSFVARQMPAVAPGGWSGVASAKQRRLSWRTVFLPGVALAAAAAAYFALSSQAVSHKLPRHRLQVPAAPVAVLDAGAAPGVARRFATRLDRLGAHVTSVDSLGGRSPLGSEVLYEPGERGQALRLVHLIEPEHLTIAPIDPVAAAAAGPVAKIVLVVS